MTAPVRMAISIPKTLFDQVEILARQHNVSRSHVVRMAIEHFIKNDRGQALLDAIHQTSENRPDSNKQDVETTPQAGGERKDVNQGDVYWVPLEAPDESEPGYTHPHVVIQDNAINRSRIQTVVVCALTSNLKRASAPGNVLLEAGEANLPRQSVVVVSQVSTVEKTQLGEYIGSLSERRIHQILAGMQFLQWFTESP